MPRNQSNYSKTIIYKIQHQEDETLLYVGSTTDFIKRKYYHKICCNDEKYREHNFKLYQIIRNNGGWECFKMIQIKEFPCNNKREAEAEEDKIMVEMKANMNFQRAHRTKKQYREDTNYTKNYYEKNKERIKQISNQQITCECGCIVVKNHIARHKKSNRHIKLLNETLKQ
jgi:hypothetical protein